MDSGTVRRVEPVMEELTGPVALGALGALVLWLPSFSVGLIGGSPTVGLVAVVSSTACVAAQLARHLRRVRTAVHIVPILVAPATGEFGQIRGLLVDEIGSESAHAAMADESPELPRAA